MGDRMPRRLEPDRLIEIYRRMKTIREFEERLHVEIATGEIPGFTHLYAGQEAVAVGVCAHLDDSDYIVSTHRGHGHCIAKGCDVTGMMLEIYGPRDGLCRGKGGSMHIADAERGMLGANAIVGGGPPIAVGAAIACRNRGDGRVSVAFGGDGSSTNALDLALRSGHSLDELERAYVRHVLEAHEGNKSAAAKALGITRRTLYRKLGEG